MALRNKLKTLFIILTLACKSKSAHHLFLIPFLKKKKKELNEAKVISALEFFSNL